jgi:hypothetical protein
MSYAMNWRTSRSIRPRFGGAAFWIFSRAANWTLPGICATPRLGQLRRSPWRILPGVFK